jgi:hypothetical protein
MTGAILHSFKSRYGDERRLIGVDTDTYIVEGVSHYTRGSTDGSGDVMADFEGGPFLMRGMTIEQATGFPLQALIQSVRFLPCETPNHARCEVRVQAQTNPAQQR